MQKFAVAGYLTYLGLFCSYNKKIVDRVGITTRSYYMLKAVTYVINIRTHSCKTKKLKNIYTTKLFTFLR